MRAAHRRVEVRPWRAEDAEQVAPWWSEAFQAACGAAAPPSPPEGCTGELWSLCWRGRVVGVTAVEVAGGWTIFRLVAVAAAARGRGLGSEGLRALEEAIRAEGRPCRFRGLAGVGNGRALYFWLRLGYRPEAEAATAPGGGIRLVRESCQEVHP